MRPRVAVPKSHRHRATSAGLKVAFWSIAAGAIYSYEVSRPGTAFALGAAAIALLAGDFFLESRRWKYAEKVRDSDYPPKPEK